MSLFACGGVVLLCLFAFVFVLSRLPLVLQVLRLVGGVASCLRMEETKRCRYV